jgi:glycerol-3-phosphate acyltransferase PlsY
MTMSLVLQIFVFPIAAYLLGALSAAIWLTRRKTGQDVRDQGSKHATTTNTIRQAGWLTGAGVLVFDIIKGFIPVYLAAQQQAPDWLVGLTAAAAVVGHCWPIYYGFRGGMGLATAGGAYLAVSPIGFAVGIAALLLSVLVIRHSARGSFVAALLTPFVLWLLPLGTTVVIVSAAVGLVLAARFSIDLHRRYHELWLDRPPADQPSD